MWFLLTRFSLTRSLFIAVSRVSVADYDECTSNEHNDCADNSNCFNTEGSYTCSCKDGYHDLSGPDSLPGRVCSGNLRQFLIYI
jgi:hypothetical protein